MKVDTILILDFGGQYAHLIGRRVRAFSVYSEVVPCDISLEEVTKIAETFQIKGIILSGGPASVYDEDAPDFDTRLLAMQLPILGLCYGHHLLAHLLGGTVKGSIKREYGTADAYIDNPTGILEGLDSIEPVWMSHGDHVLSLPTEFEILAHTTNCPIAAFQHKTQSIIGLQWHPEVVHTQNGDKMLHNFVFLICECSPNWKVEDFTIKAVQEIKTIVGAEKAIIALSGGVDSSVATALATKALGKQLTAVFVDHGFMRKGEPELIRQTFEHSGLHFIVVDARQRFLEKLTGVSDPERKRKIIGEEFIRVFEQIGTEIDATYLLQGTIYPDRIESGHRKHSDKIKTHHNVAGLPIQIAFKSIVEPLRDLYKDEVRKVGQQLGLPETIVFRQPFPGPGLAVRITDAITMEQINILQEADAIVRDELEASTIHKDLWQYFAVLTNTRSTGVKGDARSYGFTIAIRAVESREAMTARFAHIPFSILEKISTRITNEIPEVSRVVYDITHKPPATIEWE